MGAGAAALALLVLLGLCSWAMLGHQRWLVGGGYQGVSGGALEGSWHFHSVGANTLV
jgi:hypothetical protein